MFLFGAALTSLLIVLGVQLGFRQTNAVLVSVTVLLCMVTYVIYDSDPAFHRVNDPLLRSVHEKLMLLSPKAQNIWLTRGSKSSTRYKSKITLCTYRKNGEQFDSNTLMNVAIHELAHVLYEGDSSDHPTKWYELYDELREKAHTIGILDKNAMLDDAECRY